MLRRVIPVALSELIEAALNNRIFLIFVYYLSDIKINQFSVSFSERTVNSS